MESIFGISQRYNAVMALAEDDSIPQEEVNAALMAVMDDVKSKGENGINYLNAIDEAISGAKERKRKCDAYIKSLESRKKRILNAYMDAMQQMGMKSIMTSAGEIKVKKNPPSVIVDDVTLLPDDYKHTTITVTPDKPAIKTAIRNGETVPGAHIEQAVSLSY